MFSVITVFGINTGALIGGALVVERFFLIPGLGTTIVEAILREDFPVVLAIVMIVVGCVRRARTSSSTCCTPCSIRGCDMTVEGSTCQVDAVTVHAVDESIPDRVRGEATLGLGFWLSVGWMVLIVSLAILAPVLPLKDPRTNFTGAGNAGPNASPSLDHWFGTDEDARDVFSRTIFGARVSLVVGFAAIAFGMIIGGTLGMIAGFVRGWFDNVVSFVFLVLLSFPALVLAILITALLDRSLFTISLTLGILAIAPVGRLARAATLVFAEREFVMAARTSRGRRTPASSCANCCPTWSFPWGRWPCSAWRSPSSPRAASPSSVCRSSRASPGAS